jgi:FkbM family methyltransferase
MINNFLNYISLNKNEEFIIFDVGSRDCIQSIEFYNSFPNAKIFAFECNPNTVPICRKNIENYKDRITLIEGAVCDYNGEIKFYPINQQKTITSWSDGNPGASSLFKSNGMYTLETYVQDEIYVKCHTLDSILVKYNIPRVDIIWMDLQGAELLALKGLSNNLHNVKYIHTEVCIKPIYENQGLFPEINDYLTNLFCFEPVNNFDISSYFTDVIYKNKFLEEPIFPNIDLTWHEQTYVRGKPRKYLLHAINLFKNFTNAKVILEIGSVRNKMNHDITEFNPSCCNDGHSTYFWKYYTNADIYTVDIDSNCKYIVDNDVRLEGVKSYAMDAFEFEKSFNEKIDLLFLDAWDVVLNSPYDTAHLNIYKQLKNRLSDSCIILIDDTDVSNGGKGKLLIPELIKEGFTMLINKRQAIFIKTHL